MTEHIQRLSRPRPNIKARMLLAVILIVVVGTSLTILLKSLRPDHGEDSSRVRSASNLRQIGQAILMYTNENGGRYPDSFSTLLMAEPIDSSAFVSPRTYDTPALGPTTQAVAAHLNTGNHCSYVYLGKGLRCTNVTPDTIVAYEVPGKLDEGLNLLFGDGRVEFSSERLQAFLTDLAAQTPASTQPVTLPPN